jgi:hypothetical protein
LYLLYLQFADVLVDMPVNPAVHAQVRRRGTEKNTVPVVFLTKKMAKKNTNGTVFKQN